MDDDSGESAVEDEVAGVGKEEMSQTESGWSEVVGEKPEADSRDEVRHTERNGQC